MGLDGDLGMTLTQAREAARMARDKVRAGVGSTWMPRRGPFPQTA
jgi:hypothetical protein